MIPRAAAAFSELSILNVFRSLRHAVAQLIFLTLIVLVTLFLGRVFHDQHTPPLKPWHTATLANEFYAGRPGVSTFQAYRQLEDRLFLELDQRIETPLAPEDRTPLNRFYKQALSAPGRQAKNWNHSFVSIPSHPRGVAVLLHGLTDSPYTMHAMAEFFVQHGYAVFLPRLPGHGTIPAQLMQTHWEDWTQAVRLTCQAAERVPRGSGLFVLCGYSNGGLLAVQYVLDQMKQSPQASLPDRLILFAPAIGITRFAAFAGLFRVLPHLPCFAKMAWLTVEPEYDPFKYNSFPKFAGDQTYRLIRRVNQQLEDLQKSDGFGRFPPVLTLTSVVDSTVLTPALVDRFYSKLKQPSELVLYDINRNASAAQFIEHSPDRFLSAVTTTPSAYTLTLITNDRRDSRRVVARQRLARSSAWKTTPLGLEWPRGVYSLSHLAIPNSPRDPLYGNRLDLLEKGQLELGLLQPRGETNILNVAASQFLRLRFNPFYDDLQKRVLRFISERH